MQLSASSLIGTPVRNGDGESLGKIEDLMIDTSEGDVTYAVLSFGGFLGVGDKLFAVPLQVLHFDTGRKEAVLYESRSRLEEAPGFDKDDWPDSADDAWLDIVRRYYSLAGEDS